MKLLIRCILSFFFFLFGAFFLLQTPLIKNYAKEILISKAKEKGIELSIEKIEGNLPFEWILKNVNYTWKNQSVSIQTTKIRLSVFPLLKKELEVSYLKGLGGSYKNIPFKVTANARIDLQRKKPTKISHFLIEGDDLFLRMEGKLHPDSSIQEGHMAFYLPDISLFFPNANQGSLMGMAQLHKNSAHLECFGEDFNIMGIDLTHSSFTIDAEKSKENWNGNILASGGHADIPLNGSAQFRYTPSCHLVSINTFQITGPEISIFGKFDLDPNLQCLEGSVFAQCVNLNVLNPLFPHSYMKGRLGARFDFQSFSNFQDLKCQIEIDHLNAFDLSCESLVLESNIYDLFGDQRGEFTIEGQQLSFQEMQLSTVEIKSIFEPHASPFELVIKGNWKNPLEVIGKGSWQKRDHGIFFNVTDFYGKAFTKPFSLCESFSIDWNNQHFRMSNFSMDVAQGHLSSRIDLGKTTTLIKVNAQKFPLEFIALPHKHFSLTGIGSFDIDLTAWKNTIQGTCNIALQRAHFLSGGIKNDIFTTKGSLQIHLHDNIAQVHGEIKAKEKQFAHFFCHLPILYQHFPFRVCIDPNKHLTGQLTSEGKLEDLLNFINIGHQRMEGWLSTKLQISKTFKQPNIHGILELQDGTYENYYIGTHLKHIYADATANNQTIYIHRLNASDGNGGSVIANGDLLLSSEKYYPFSLSAELKNLDAVSFDTITGNFSGKVNITGDRLGATARGKLEVTDAVFRIPDQFPSSLPELPIEFVNPPEIISRKSPSPAGGPFLLDLDLIVPQRVHVEGRGLHADLKGNLHVSGTYTNILAKGSLQLVSGEYIFSGKVFNLNQGELIFNDKPTPSAYISLSGDCELPDVQVTAILRGPLTSPKLTFQSSPYLSTSSLLAQILFNKDISEISAVQALQVAQTVISLSGNSAPDILGKIRKTLGIDRLTLITSENDPGKISLQIGKYLMRGVLLTLSQGAESRNVSVEVDLKKGIKFQAEVNEDQQGKFSLKWHHHY